MPGARRSESRIVAWFAVALCVGALGFVVRSLWTDGSVEGDEGSRANPQSEVLRTPVAPSIDATDGTKPDDEEGADRVDITIAEAASADRTTVETDAPVRLRGEVLAADGGPASLATVSVRIARQLTDRWEYFEAARGETVADGTFELEIAASLAREARIASLVVTRAPAEAGVASIAATLRDGGSRPVSLRLEPAGGGDVRVIDAEGRPVAAAVVTPHAFPQFEVRTDEHGIAAFPAIPVGPRKFSALTPGRPIATTESVDIAEGGAFSIDLVVGRGVVVKGKVVDRDDRPLPGATVRIDGALASEVADESGRFEFADVAPGKRRAVAVLGDLRAVGVDFEAPSEELVIRIHTGRIAEFACVDAQGRPIEPAELYVEEVARGKVAVTKSNQIRLRLETAGLVGAFAVDAKASLARLEPSRAASSLGSSSPIVGSTRLTKIAVVRDGTGRFRMYAQSGGDPIFLVAKHDRLGLAVAGPWNPNHPESDARVEFGRGGRLAIEVVDSNGALMAAEVRVAARNQDLLVARVDDRGRCDVAGLPHDDLTVTVSCESAATETQSLRLEPGVVANLRFELEVGTRLVGVAFDATGRPMRDAELWFHAAADPMRELAHAITDAEGAYRVEHLPLGPLQVRVRPDVSGIRFGAEMVNEFLQEPIVVEVSGSEEQRIDLRTTWPAPTRVVIDSRFASTNYELRRDQDGSGFRVDGPPATLDRGRVAEFDCAPGRYVVTFQGDGGSWFATAPQRFEPGTTTTVRLYALATQSLTGVVEDASGRPLEGVALYYLWTEAWRPKLVGGRAISPSCDVDVGMWRVITGTDGSFALPPGQVRGHVLVAAKKGLEPLHVPVDEELARRVPLRLRPQPAKR